MDTSVGAVKEESPAAASPCAGDFALVCTHTRDVTDLHEMKMVFWRMPQSEKVQFLGACESCFVTADGDLDRIEFSLLMQFVADTHSRSLAS